MSLSDMREALLKKLLFLYDPTAGKGLAPKELASVLDLFTKAGWLVTTYPTQNKGDAARAARELSPLFSRVVCAGEDGTLSETVSSLIDMETTPVLGYIPFGSISDCAANLDLPRVPGQAATIAAGEGVLRAIDIGRLNGRSFVYVAAFGAFTQVAYSTPQDLKNAFGYMAYILGGITSLPAITPYHLKVEYDGNVIEDDFFFGMVSNTRSIGGVRMPQNNHVVLDDGLFEVNLIKRPVSLADVTDGLQTLLEQNSPSAGVRVHFQASHLIFTGDIPIPWTIDGEFGGSQKVNTAENCRQALSIICGK